MDRITYDCINYNISVFDLFIPPLDVLYKLCISSDKTKLVLISMARFLILLVLFYFLWAKKSVSSRPNSSLYFYLV